MTKDELIHEMNSFSYMKIYGRMYVLRPIERDARYNCPNPDFIGTHNALVGIGRKGETLEEFKKRWLEIRMKHDLE